jgi:hypothetical protein
VIATVIVAIVITVVMPEVEEVEEIPKRRTVQRHVGIVIGDARFGKLSRLRCLRRFQRPGV